MNFCKGNCCVALGVLTEKDKSSILKWKEILNDLVEICFEMIPTVSSVVNSSSPEGHLPMDFQTDFEERLKITCSEGTIHIWISLFILFIGTNTNKSIERKYFFLISVYVYNLIECVIVIL